MAEALNRSRTGHLSAINLLESSIKYIVDKEPFIITIVELYKLKLALKECIEQRSKISAQILKKCWLQCVK